MPTYTSRYFGFLTNEDPSIWNKRLLNSINSDTSYDKDIPTCEYQDPDTIITTTTIPIWKHKGDLQLVYNATLPKPT